MFDWRKFSYRKLLLGLLLLAVFLYGVMVGRFRWFPYEYLQLLKTRLESQLADAGDAVPRPERNREYRIQQFELLSGKADVVFVGDSITEGGEWSEFFPQITVANRGVSGDKVSDVLRRIDSILTTHADAALLMLGINDIDRHVAQEKTFTDYENLIRRLQNGGMRVLVQSTIQCAPGRCGVDKVSQVNELNRHLKAFARNQGVTYLDLGLLSAENGLDGRFTYDGIHLNGAGYQHWKGVLEPLMSGFRTRQVAPVGWPEQLGGIRTEEYVKQFSPKASEGARP